MEDDNGLVALIAATDVVERSGVVSGLVDISAKVVAKLAAEFFVEPEKNELELGTPAETVVVDTVAVLDNDSFSVALVSGNETA